MSTGGNNTKTQGDCILGDVAGFQAFTKGRQKSVDCLAGKKNVVKPRNCALRFCHVLPAIALVDTALLSIQTQCHPCRSCTAPLSQLNISRPYEFAPHQTNSGATLPTDRVFLLCLQAELADPLASPLPSNVMQQLKYNYQCPFCQLHQIKCCVTIVAQNSLLVSGLAL